jgi:hypothetical protein
MDDPVTASAKAVEATAKATGQGLEIVHDTGGYLARVFADVPRDLVGLLGGAWIHEQHIRLRHRLCWRTEEIVAERDVREFVQLSPNIAAALVAGAQEESREELLELWARLLANAVDPKLNNIRGSFIAAVKAMDPMDARVLYYMHSENIGRIRVGSGGSKADVSVEFIATELHTRQDEVEVSIRHLNDLGFMNPLQPAADPNVWFPGAKTREFMRACYPE